MLIPPITPQSALSSLHCKPIRMTLGRSSPSSSSSVHQLLSTLSPLHPPIKIIHRLTFLVASHMCCALLKLRTELVQSDVCGCAINIIILHVFYSNNTERTERYTETVAEEEQGALTMTKILWNTRIVGTSRRCSWSSSSRGREAKTTIEQRFNCSTNHTHDKMPQHQFWGSVRLWPFYLFLK